MGTCDGESELFLEPLLFAFSFMHMSFDRRGEMDCTCGCAGQAQVPAMKQGKELNTFPTHCKGIDLQHTEWVAVYLAGF